jgi:uncharacterized protein YrrD
MLEDLHIGVPVRGSNGNHLGSLSRVVIEPSSKQVTHLVVEPGLVESGNLLKPGGWETPREHVVPMSLVAAASKDEVRLTCDESAFQRLPLFERKQYADVDAAATGTRGQSRFQLGELVNFVAAGWGLGAAPYIAPADISLNETPGSVAIEEGSPVWRLDPHEEIGAVERVLVDAATQRVSALVVRRSGLLHHRVLLPIEKVSGVDDGVVHVTLSPAEVDALAPFTEEQ